MSGLKIRKGDRVRVLTGKDRGKEGTISRVLPDRNKVIVDGVNVAKRHTKARGDATNPGGIIQKDMPIPVPNVALICSDCGPTRVGYKFEDGVKILICRKCGSAV